MKFLNTLLIVCLLFLTSSAFATHQLYADSESVSIPYGTKFELYMADDVTTKHILEGDIFEAYLNKNIYVNNKLILPSKTIFRGRVSKVKYSRMLSRPAVLYLSLDHLVTKQGTQLPISAGISSDFQYILKTDGSLTTNGNYFKAVAKDAKKSKKVFSKALAWGKKPNNGLKYVTIPIGAIGGAVGCTSSVAYNTLADLFRHGDEIVIKKGEKFNIILLSKLEVPN